MECNCILQTSLKAPYLCGGFNLIFLDFCWVWMFKRGFNYNWCLIVESVWSWFIFLLVNWWLFCLCCCYICVLRRWMMSCCRRLIDLRLLSLSFQSDLFFISPTFISFSSSGCGHRWSSWISRSALQHRAHSLSTDQFNSSSSSSYKKSGQSSGDRGSSTT